MTTTFGANRSVTSKTFDTSKIVETSITENDAKLLPDSFVIKTGPADALVYTTYSVSSSSGDNTNVTYFDSDASDAVLIGTANTWTNSWTDPGSTYSPADTGMTIPPVSEPITGSPSEPYPTSPSATTYSETGTEFLDANNNFIGNVFNDGSYVNANFSFFDADGSRHEKGGEYQIISNAIDFSSPIREYEYNYGSNGKLVDGVRIEDGLTTEYGPEFSVQSVIDTGFADRKASIKKYEADDPLLDAYAEIGSNLIAGTDGGGAYIYKEYDLSSADPQFKLYSETGSIIARVHENIWTDYNSGQTITNYHLNDANYNFIGRIEDRGDTVRIENYTETATTKTWSGSTFVVNSGVLDTSSTGILEQFARTELLDGTFVSETRTEGGVITTFDKYGGEVSTTFANLPTLVAKTEADFEFLPEIFISSSAVYAHEVVGDYGSKKIYFFDDAQGSNQLGSADYYTHTGPKPEGGTETYENYYFYDSQGNNVGQTSISSDYKYFSANYDLGGYEIVTESSVADWGTYERYEQFYSSGPNAGLLYEGYEINGNLKTNYGFDYELINTEFYGTFDPGAMGLLELSEPSLTLDVAPVSGQLLLNEIPVLVGETVTYSDLANGALKYHPGSSAAPGDTNITQRFWTRMV